MNYHNFVVQTGTDNIMKRLISLIVIGLMISSCTTETVAVKTGIPKGQLKVGFDIDDTVVFSRDNFLEAPSLSDDPNHLDYAWINTHDAQHSSIIEPIADLIAYLRSQGHEVYFITARPGINGEGVAHYLTDELGFDVQVNDNLFFSPKKKDPETGIKYTTKHGPISKLGLHIYFGDSDTDMVAASISGIRAVRVVRDQTSVEAYSRNYFGDMKAGNTDSAPHDEVDYLRFLTKGVGPYGETIYPIYPDPEISIPAQE